MSSKIIFKVQKLNSHFVNIAELKVLVLQKKIAKCIYPKFGQALIF